MHDKSSLLDVFAVIETKKVKRAAHPSQATKSDYVIPLVDEEDVVQRVGTATVLEGGRLVIQLKAIPLSGRLFVQLGS
jgi:hypothetical protein